MKKAYVIAGGTFVHAAPHFALSAPAFGKVGRDLAALLPAAYQEAGQEVETRLIFTRMALGGAERPQADAALLLGAGIDDVETNEDLEKLVDHLVARPDTGAIVMAAAACDFRPAEVFEARFSSAMPPALSLVAEEKIIRKIRRLRKDIFLVGFKTTSGKTS
ncbi:MAG TPA: phosphopantothenoylcysteine decarboxylase, partial [Patescibacteria group bacterium]|nr:phosphopantothenoylcysteine decarboxylase [Patescibacteria group bacterium]